MKSVLTHLVCYEGTCKKTRMIALSCQILNNLDSTYKQLIDISYDLVTRFICPTIVHGEKKQRR